MSNSIDHNGVRRISSQPPYDFQGSPSLHRPASTYLLANFVKNSSLSKYSESPTSLSSLSKKMAEDRAGNLPRSNSKGARVQEIMDSYKKPGERERRVPEYNKPPVDSYSTFTSNLINRKTSSNAETIRTTDPFELNKLKPQKNNSPPNLVTRLKVQNKYQSIITQSDSNTTLPLDITQVTKVPLTATSYSSNKHVSLKDIEHQNELLSKLVDALGSMRGSITQSDYMMIKRQIFFSKSLPSPPQSPLESASNKISEQEIQFKMLKVEQLRQQQQFLAEQETSMEAMRDNLRSHYQELSNLPRISKESIISKVSLLAQQQAAIAGHEQAAYIQQVTAEHDNMQENQSDSNNISQPE